MVRKPTMQHIKTISMGVFLVLLTGLLLVGASSCNSTSVAQAQQPPEPPAEPVVFELTGDLGVHDPVIAREGDTFYVFCTGSVRRGERRGIIPIRYSKDMYHWTLYGAALEGLPEWAQEEIPRARDAWAPDISYFNGRWHLYYSVSSFGSNDSAIGLATNATLDPNSRDYEWVDQGMVIRSHRGSDDWNAIDPQLVIEDENNIWLCWGSFWGGIKMRRVDPKTGKPSSEDTTLYSLASRPATETSGRGEIEAPFIVQHDGYWYHFLSYDRCCRGPESTYNIRVGRSKEVTGPYIDRDGVSMLEGGGTMVIEATTPAWRGPGHQAVFQDVSGDYLLFHAYNGQGGRPASQLFISTIVWKDGWPQVAPLP